jgi:hypothetical protein
MMTREIVFTVYDRLGYFERTVHSWRAARGLRHWPCTVFVEPSPVAEQVAQVARRLGDHATVVANPTRLGLTTNLWQALGHGFARSQFVVLAEDDVVVAPDILEYLDWTSEHFVDDPDVLAVCAHSQATVGDVTAVTKRLWFTPWVWGTWRNRWVDSIKDNWDFDYTSGHSSNTPSGWDCNLNQRVRGARSCLYPVVGRADHIGEHGIHMSPHQYAVEPHGLAAGIGQRPCGYRLLG